MTNKKNTGLKVAAVSIVAATVTGCSIFNLNQNATAAIPSPEVTPTPKSASADDSKKPEYSTAPAQPSPSPEMKEETTASTNHNVSKAVQHEYKVVPQVTAGFSFPETSTEYVRNVSGTGNSGTSTGTNPSNRETDPVTPSVPETPSDTSAPVLMYVPNNITTKWGESPDLSEIIAIDDRDGQV